MNAPTQLAESVADFSSAEHLVRVERLLVELVSESTATHLDPFDTGRAALAHLASGGHRVRAKLGLDAGIRVGLSQDDSVVIGAAVELLHNASSTTTFTMARCFVAEFPRSSPLAVLM